MENSEFKIFFKDKDAFTKVRIEILSKTIDVRIYDLNAGDTLSDYAKRGLKTIQNISEIQKGKIIIEFWRFAPSRPRLRRGCLRNAFVTLLFQLILKFKGRFSENLAPQ